uniref:lysozyme n=1 Tax=Platymeris rhadamanthus TaxID=1134088 RepID=A0A6B9KZ72_PLARH|nr:venom lysozyme 1 [Platymeris rhadamanthus]
MKVAFILLFLFGLSQAKVFTRCGLAKELVAKGIPRGDIDNWVCLVESESSRNTKLKGGPNSNKSYDHGLFQINDRYWCKNGHKGGDCKVSCEDLRKDDITAAVKCALLIKKRQGFNAWYGWKNRCKNKSVPSVAHCLK